MSNIVTESPESHQWWVDTTASLLRTLEAASHHYSESYSRCTGDPDALRAEDDLWDRALGRYYRSLLDAWKRHRPDGPLEGECVPNAVHEAIESVGGRL